MWTKRNWGPTQVGSGKFFSPYPSGPLMRQERLLSVGTDGGGYIIYYVPIKMISLSCRDTSASPARYSCKAIFSRARRQSRAHRRFPRAARQQASRSHRICSPTAAAATSVDPTTRCCPAVCQTDYRSPGRPLWAGCLRSSATTLRSN